MKIQSIYVKIMCPMILIVCLMAVSILSITGRLFTGTYETQIRNQIGDSCHLIAQSVESFMDRAYAVTDELANYEGILTMDHQTQTPIVEGTAARNDYFELIYIQDMKGDQTARSQGELGNRANRWWFIQMLEEDRAFVSKSYYSVATNMACASIFMPLKKDGATIGILATDLKLASLQSLVEDFSDTEAGRITYIIDGEGTVVAHPESVYFEELYNYKTLTKTVTKKDSNGKTVYDSDGNIETEEISINISAEYKDLIAAVMAGKSGQTQITDNNTDYFVSYTPIRLKGNSDSWSVITLQDRSKAMSLMNRVSRTGMLITLAAVIVSVFIISFVTRTIIKPIKLSHKRLRQLSEGDLTTVVPDVKGKDEGAQLLRDLNITIGVLRDIIYKINDSVNKIAAGDFRKAELGEFSGEFNSIVASLAKIMNSMGSTLHQINDCANHFLNELSGLDNSVQSLAHSTTGQAGAVEELSSTIMEITGKVSQNAQNSQNADRMMLSVQSKLEEGSSNLAHLTNAMETIETNSMEIRKITEIMNDIASNTNLLAMNASVEASRAGLAGKGFAVVASEIRTLANQCSQAVVETSDLVERTRKNVHAGMVNLKDTVTSIKTALEENTSASRLIGDISSATTEQSEAIEQLNITIQQISENTQGSSFTASESAQASASMKRQAGRLKQLLSVYKF